MIISQLSGGLGNQMFQYAAAYALADHLGEECRVDVTTFQQNVRKYELAVFAGAPVFARPSDIPFPYRQSRSRPGRLVARIVGPVRLGKVAVFNERSPFVFDDRFFQAGKNTYLIGYFQTERYFVRCADKIRQIYDFVPRPDHRNQALLDRIRSTNAVSVHVRRGDYVTNPKYNKHHGTCSLEYYQEAFAIIMGRVHHPSFYVFSDDPDWAAANVKPPAEAVYADHNRVDASYEDMRLMANCRHNIIANSSFSWWAAWLNANPDKIVVAPKRWLASQQLEVRDLIPTRWFQC